MTEFLVRSALCALMPPAAGIPGLCDTDVRGFVGRLRRESTWMYWLGILGGTFVFTVTPIMTVFLPLPSFLLPEGALDRHAQGITGTRFYLLRQSIFLLKMAAGMCWGADPEVRRRFALEAYEPDPGTWRSSGEIV